MSLDKVIHYGYFIRRWRESQGMSRLKFIAAMRRAVGPDARLSEKRLFEIEKMASPLKVYERTDEMIGKTMGYDSVEAFGQAWRTTPVKSYKGNYDAVGEEPRQSLDLPLPLIKRITDTAATRSQPVADLLTYALDLVVKAHAPAKKLPVANISTAGEAEFTNEGESPGAKSRRGRKRSE